MLNAVMTWTREHTSWLNSLGFSVDMNRDDRFRPAAVNIVLESREYIASVTVWESGAIDMNVLSVETEQSVYLNHYDVRSGVEAERALDTFTRELAVRGFA